MNPRAYWSAFNRTDERRNSSIEDRIMDTMIKYNPSIYRTMRMRRRQAFTMIEIILVIVIIMTLAAVVGPRLVGKSQKAKKDTTRLQMNAVKMALQEFEIHAGRFPTSSEGLDALIKRPSGLSENEWPSRYMDKLPRDSWGEPFNYKYPSDNGMDFDLISSGPDKKMGTDDDITNFEEGSI